MNLITALILFNILILTYQVIIEIFTTLFRINGVNLDKAKFQVISLLTGTGFTTKESELMLLTKKRRKLTQRIMLFSYIFNISIVSIFVNVFVASINTTAIELKVGIVFTICNMILMVFINKSPAFRGLIDNMVIFIINRKNKNNNNFLTIYDTYVSKVLAEIQLKNIPTKIKDKTIEEMHLGSKYKLQLLIIKRKEEVISDIKLNTILEENDTILIFGKVKDIKKLFMKDIDEETKQELDKIEAKL